MSLIADADVPAPVVTALKAVRYDIKTWDEIGLPLRPDAELMAALLERGHLVLMTRDTGIPSQAYAFEYAKNGLTLVVLRWKTQHPADWQQMVVRVLQDGATWERLAAVTPSVISASHSGSRARAWSEIPEGIAAKNRG